MIIYKNIECISVCKRERMWIYIMWGNGEPYKFRGKRIRKPKCKAIPPLGSDYVEEGTKITRK